MSDQAAIGQEPGDRLAKRHRVGALGAEPGPYLVHDLSRRGHHPNSDQRSPIDDDFAVYENSILAVVPPDRFYFDRELTAETRRHTDGMYS